MYSVVLMMSMQAMPTGPAGLLIHRRAAGCSGVVAVVPVQQTQGCTGGFAAGPQAVTVAPAAGVQFVSTSAALPQVTLMAVPAAPRRLTGHRQCGPGQVCAIYE